MKQYDVIYIPTNEVIDNGLGVFRAPDFEATDYVGEVEENCNAIVLTIEELSNIWNAGYSAGRDDLLTEQGTPAIGKIVPDFEDYLKSKGIQI